MEISPKHWVRRIWTSSRHAGDPSANGQQQASQPQGLLLTARIFIILTASLGCAITVGALLEWHSSDPLRFVCFFVVALLSAGFKVELPGIDGSMSVNFMFIIVGIFELSLPETLVIGCASAAVQCLWDVKNRPAPVKILFNVFSMMALPPPITVSSGRSAATRRSKTSAT